MTLTRWAGAKGRRESAEAAVAFSVIELLVVIAVIGIIAALVLGVMPGVMQKKTMARVQTELKQLEAAIEYYKEKHGFYPPDHPRDASSPPLFYELIGTTNSGNTFYPLNGEPLIRTKQIDDYFQRDGFVNTAADASDVKNFYPTIRRDQYLADTGRMNTIFLVVPAKGPGPNEDFNPWRYVVAKPDARPTDPYPTNNPSSFDLWAEVSYGGRTHVIGNWKK